MKTRIVLLLTAACLCGCGKTPVEEEPPPADPSATVYDFVFEKPYFMEYKPQGQNIGPLRWIWYAEDKLLNMTHILNQQSAELFESPEGLKTAVANETGLNLTAEFTRESPERLTYRHEDAKGIVFAVAENTPDGQTTVAIFGIFPTVPKELRSMKKVEAILETLKKGRFEKQSDAWPPS